MIDIQMVEFSDTAAKELGIDFLWSNSGAGVQISPTGDDNIIFRTVGTLTKEFQAEIKALEEKKQAWVRAKPRIATVSGQQASIFVGRQRYLSEPVTVSGGDEGYGRTLNFIDAGISLSMTPWTGGDGEIIVEVEPEISVMSAPDPFTGLPEKSTRRADTIVRVRDGDTIIIGGLIQDELQLTKTKIPILGDLPLLGPLFRSVNKNQVKTELVIFITPHILGKADTISPEDRQQVIKNVLENEEVGAGAEK
jgi:type IV pilus assembly protein PilQ